VLRGEDKPKDAAEGIGFADFAYNSKRLGASVRLYTESFRTDPKLAEDTNSGHRYNAACAAALAGTGQGVDKPPLDEPEKARWRKQALDWLRADLVHWTKQAEAGKPEANSLIGQTLQHWKDDTDLAGIRDLDGLAKLPENEQTAYRAFWGDVDALLKKVQIDQP
jgi:hypothetical protein